MTYTIGSLFDGSGGFPLAASLCGMTPLWASEVEPYPIAVTRSLFPNMKHLGSVTDVHGDSVDPVDVITFGSPCQDLSVAGKRAGLKHEANGDEETTRSGLFMEAVRIIKEMRDATNGEYPSFALWENVPGAFSSNKGEDFRTVIEELVGIVEPDAVMPPVPKAGWAYADSYRGDGWSLAYRVFDAQYWGVPQRRRRIHLVLDLRGERAGEVLFEREGVRGYFAQGGAKGKGIASDSQRGSDTDDREKQYLFENHSQDTRYRGPLNVSPMLPAQLGTGGNNTPFVVARKPAAYCMGNGQLNQMSMAEQSNTLDCMHDQQAVVVFDKEVYNSGINATGAHYISEGGVAPSLRTQHPPGIVSRYIVRRLTPTECARLQGFADKWGHIDSKDDFTDEEYRFWLDVRNTHASINGKQVKDYTKAQMLKWYNGLHTDSSEYKMWGNGIALPPALYCMQGIEIALTKEELL